MPAAALTADVSAAEDELDAALPEIPHRVQERGPQGGREADFEPGAQPAPRENVLAQHLEVVGYHLAGEAEWLF